MVSTIEGAPSGASVADNGRVSPSDTSAPELSVVIPACNEAARIGGSLQEARAYLDELGLRYELIVVDDGSRDLTRALVAEQIASWPHARLIGYGVNRGKGHALRTGILASAGGRVLFTDADLSTPLAEIPRALARLDAGAGVVIGSRSAVGARVARSQPLYRRWGSKLFNRIRDGLLGLADLGDTQCGFKAFDGDTARLLFGLSHIERWMFDVEVLYLARRLGVRIDTLPVRWADVRGSKLRLFRDTAHMVRDLLAIRLRHRTSSALESPRGRLPRVVARGLAPPRHDAGQRPAAKAAHADRPAADHLRRYDGGGR